LAPYQEQVGQATRQDRLILTVAFPTSILNYTDRVLKDIESAMWPEMSDRKWATGNGRLETAAKNGKPARRNAPGLTRLISPRGF